ncbi:MFS transporter [uncultured Bradyrhizobium sp.]|uniref:MFS transporter n=1 Tax=Bradyrhizobium sp. TaxID=376 RepID=UPI00262245EB|nr:MFS transporter [uncultured Bradyrhizobium sp.]
MSAATSSSEDYTPGQRYSIMISAMLGYILDFYDVLIFPFLLPAIQRSMSLSLTEVGSLQALTLFGSAIGGALFGVIGDRFGRKTSLQLTIALFSVAAIVSAFAWNYWSLAALRLITGIGLGGEYGVGMVLFNEAWKKGSRGLGAAALQGCAVIASSTASIVGIWLIATFSDEWSWRIGLLSGGVPILLIIFIRFFMPESKIWLEYEAQRKASRATAEARTLPLADLFRNGLARQTVIGFVWLMSYMLCYYSVVSFIPTLLLRDMHTPGDVVRTTAVLLSVVSGICYLANGFFNDRAGRRFGALVPALFWVGSLVGMAVWGSQLYAGSKTEWPMFWLYIGFGIGNVALGVTGVWISELYPVNLRATAVSTFYMGGRGLGSIAPVIVPLAAGHLGGSLLNGMVAVALPAAAIFILSSLLLPETLGRDLSARGFKVDTETEGNMKAASVSGV